MRSGVSGDAGGLVPMIAADTFAAKLTANANEKICGHFIGKLKVVPTEGVEAKLEAFVTLHKPAS